MSAGQLVRALYEAYHDRDWDRATALLHPDTDVALPATAERLTGRSVVMDFQRSYPEPWGTMAVDAVVAEDDAAAAEVSVVDPSGRTFALAAFWRTRDGLLHTGTEYWIEVGADSPPASRARSEITRSARRAWDR